MDVRNGKHIQLFCCSIYLENLTNKQCSHSIKKKTTHLYYLTIICFNQDRNSHKKRPKRGGILAKETANNFPLLNDPTHSDAVYHCDQSNSDFFFNFPKMK